MIPSDVTNSNDEKLRRASQKLHYMLAAENEFAVSVNVASMEGVWPESIEREIARVGELGFAAARCFVIIGQRPDATDPAIWQQVRVVGAQVCPGLFTRQPTIVYEQATADVLRMMKAELAKNRPVLDN